MPKKFAWIVPACAGMLSLGICRSSSAVTVNLLATLSIANGTPISGTIARDADGNIFGTGDSGGANGVGAVFEYNAASQTVSTLYSFPDHSNASTPFNGVTLDSSGNLFGTTIGGGFLGAVLFKIDGTTHAYSTLGTFDSTYGQMSSGNVILDSSGNIFGTSIGGASDSGRIWKYSPATQKLTVLHAFTAAGEGWEPIGKLVEDAAGNLYGTNFIGDATSSYGTIFKYSTTTNTFSTLYRFKSTDGHRPLGGLTLDSAGMLYGTTYDGLNGAPTGGTIFKFDQSASTFSTLANLSAVGTDSRASMIVDSYGNLFGTTREGGNYGTIFELPIGSTRPKVLAIMSAATGKYLESSVVADSSNNLYVSTVGGTLLQLTNTGFNTVPEPSSLAIGFIGLTLFPRRSPRRSALLPPPAVG